MDKALKARAIIVCLILVTGLSALSVRLLTIQVWDRKLTDKSSIPHFKLKTVIPASRGLIVDRHQTVLAQNRPQGALIADLTHLNFYDHLTRAVAHRHASQIPGWRNLTKAERIQRLAEYRRFVLKQEDREAVIREHLDYATEVIGRELQMTSRELKEKILSGRKRVVVKKGIREDVIRRLEKELQARRVQGFTFERSQQRFYPMPTLAPHMVGFTNYQGKGVAGIERTYEEILAGEDGFRELRRDENGLVHLTEAAKVRPPKLGKHVRLTLDMKMQSIVEEELTKGCGIYHAKKGTIIVIEPEKGDILAMATRPHYDLNDRSDLTHAFSSFPINAQYESGSVLKIVGLAGALDAGVARRTDYVFCGWGKLKRRNFTVRDHHQYGDLSFDQVLLKSSNPGAFLFSERLGRERFYRYLRGFGFGRQTDFPLPGEAHGRISDPTNPQNFASATYGYGVSVTPIQLGMAYTALANGGRLLKPRVVDSIIANNGAVLETKPVEVVNEVISGKAARDMRLALEKVVTKGTGKRAAVPGHRVAGKTGSAWKWDSKARAYSRTKMHLSFCGMLPVEDPKFVCIVVIDEPSGLGEYKISGGTIAAPIFANVSARLASYLNIPRTEPVEEDATPIALLPRQ